MRFNGDMMMSVLARIIAEMVIKFFTDQVPVATLVALYSTTETPACFFFKPLFALF
ncbi:hypothetical protein Hanom_Chr04g00280631 [Helianthus anomalus]